jgi:hexosaminidase
MFLHKSKILADRPGEGTVRSEAYVDYLSLPRMAALAEVTWTPVALRNWDDFSQRMQSMYARYSYSKYNYRMPIPVVKKSDAGKGRTRLTVKSPVEGGTLHFTTNGVIPTAKDTRYTNPVVVDDVKSFQVVAVGPGGAPTSLPFFTKSNIPAAWRRYGKNIGTWHTAGMPQGKPGKIVLNATGYIDRNADYIVTFLYTKGKDGLDIDGIHALRNGKIASAEDIHKGFAGARSHDNAYRINIKNYETGARFEIIADISDNFGNNSNGMVFIKRAKHKQ